MNQKFIWIFLILIFLISCTQKQENNNIQNVIVPDKRIELWNGQDFKAWIKFIPDKNVNPDSVWFISDENLYCAGNPICYIRTNSKYKNYKLTVVWRWPEEPGNSGVLLHIEEPDTVWPKCIEAQLMHENAGDFYVINGTDFDELIDKASRRLAKKENNSENKPGEWNTYEIYCQENTITLFVNNVLQNKATNCSVKSGQIGFQSEGKPIEFKEIFIEPLKLS
ncbi:MAG: DUF1080 domain-containing protein [Ignavibacteriae bacterium]|nr:DUF1080 domain-containing protein [Ignavibacteriota bacterium]MCB9208695.1 DUF1080 domain-containing protein [Ignavibacteriales bacterium]